jgi:hypothetical protein
MECNCVQLAIKCGTCSTSSEDVAMMRAYLDESGTHGDSLIQCVTGVLYDHRSLTLLNRAWAKELKVAGVERFRVTDFRKTPEEEERDDRLYRKLIPIIVKHAQGSVTVLSVSGEKDPFRRWDWGFSPYTACSYACMEKLRQIAVRNLGHKELDFVIEDGHKDAGELRQVLKEKLRAPGGWPGVHDYRFHGKGPYAIETAGILAYELTKCLKDPNRPLRKSLQALLPEGMDRHNNKATYLTESMLESVVYETRRKR